MHASDGTQEYADFDPQDRGYHYVDAVEYSGRNLAFMFSSDSRDEKFSLHGAMRDGRCTGTVRADVNIGNQDRVILKEAVRVSSVEVTRAASGSVDTVDLRWIQELLLVFDGATSYTVNQAVKVVTNASTGVSEIRWTTGAITPVAGSKYMINVTAFPVWIVQGKPMRRGYTPDEPGPWRVDLELDDERVRRG